MLTGILIAMACFGSQDTCKQVKQTIVNKKIIEQKRVLKQVEKPFDDTLKLLKELKAHKEKKGGLQSNEQVKLNK